VWVLGISAFYHDSAAALVGEGGIVAAAQEERFSRKKHDARFPAHALEYCLAEAGVRLGDIDYVVFYDKPLLKFERLLETYLAFAPRGFKSFGMAIPLWLREKLFLKDLIVGELKRRGDRDNRGDALLFSEHHLSHAASAFFPSPFDEAAVLTMDGVGEWATTSLAHGQGNRLEVLREIHFPHSIGLLYSAFTYYTGFKVNSGEYKVMGLAPYGEPRFAPLIFEHLIDLKADGSFRLNLDYFDYCTGLTMTNGRFDALPAGYRGLLIGKDRTKYDELMKNKKGSSEDIEWLRSRILGEAIPSFQRDADMIRSKVLELEPKLKENVASDVIYRKNGTKFEGQIQQETDTFVKIKHQFGAVTIPEDKNASCMKFRPLMGSSRTRRSSITWERLASCSCICPAVASTVTESVTCPTSKVISSCKV
jgi:predicted NodU family carbamoyl transferase